MTTKLQGDLARYIDHFEAERDKISYLKDPLHRKLLIVSMLSALAEGRYSRTKGDRAKFIDLIENHSNWEHATSISISQLQMVIQKRRPDGLSEGFVDEISRRHKEWRQPHSPISVVELGDDPKISTFSSSLSIKDRNLLDAMKHSSLLYLYRCKLVHEFREPGHGMEVFEDHAPYYHSRIDLADNSQTMELVYPTRWFVGLVLPILIRLKEYYATADVNPYDSYNFGSPWKQSG